MDERPLVSIREAAKALSLCSATVYRMIKRSEIPAVRLGKAVRLRPEDVEAIRKNGLPNKCTQGNPGASQSLRSLALKALEEKLGRTPTSEDILSLWKESMWDEY